MTNTSTDPIKNRDTRNTLKVMHVKLG